MIAGKWARIDEYQVKMPLVITFSNNKFKVPNKQKGYIRLRLTEKQYKS